MIDGASTTLTSLSLFKMILAAPLNLVSEGYFVVIVNLRQNSSPTTSMMPPPKHINPPNKIISHRKHHLTQQLTKPTISNHHKDTCLPTYLPVAIHIRTNSLKSHDRVSTDPNLRNST